MLSTTRAIWTNLDEEVFYLTFFVIILHVLENTSTTSFGKITLLRTRRSWVCYTSLTYISWSAWFSSSRDVFFGDWSSDFFKLFKQIFGKQELLKNDTCKSINSSRDSSWYYVMSIDEFSVRTTLVLVSMSSCLWRSFSESYCLSSFILNLICHIIRHVLSIRKVCFRAPMKYDEYFD